MFQIENVIVENVLEIKNLTLYKDVISIEGQSGSGKSTFLRLLNNLDNPTLGKITYKKQALSDIPALALRKRIVMVPQDPVVFDGTIRDNLNIGLELSCEKPVSDVELKDMLNIFWLNKSLDVSASDLSGGEKQRMSLVRVLLMKRTEVFLLDEPTSSLDDKTTGHVMGKFLEWTYKQKQQVIMITHEKKVSEEFADEVITMDEYSKQIKGARK